MTNLKGKELIEKSQNNISNLTEKLVERYRFTTLQLTSVLEAYKDKTEKLKVKISELDDHYKDFIECTTISINDLIFDALVGEKEIL